MNRARRTAAAAATLALVSGLGVAGVASAADLLEAPTADQAHDVAAWTSVVSRSYARAYGEVACTTVEPGTGDSLDLGAAPSGTWMFAVVGPPGDQTQYGPAELPGAAAPGEAAQVIACHGVPAAVPLAVSAPSGVPQPIQAGEGPARTPAEVAETEPSPEPSVGVPAAVEAGLGGGGGGLAALTGGLLAVIVLALRGRAVRAR